MSFFSTTLLILVVAGAVAWIARLPRRPRDPDRVIDSDALEQAEEEVRDLNAFTTPEDAQDELPDWGPGAPKH